MQIQCSVVQQFRDGRFGSKGALCVLFFVVCCLSLARAQSVIVPGATWHDTSGHVLEAHGAGVIQVGSTYYMVGEDHSTSASFSGINCYSSSDLVNWTFVADILPPQPSGDLTSAAVIQRPKVIYNSSTNEYVMWMHVDNSNYSKHSVGVATSPTVCGKYSYQGSFEPEGFPSYDMGLFKDADGSAYLLTTDNNVALRIEKLTSDYLNVASISATLPSMEGPAMAKVNGTYYIFCSHLTGWAPNDDQYATASAINGTWSSLQDFADPGKNTYNSQSAWIFPVTGTSGTTYMYMGDRWNSSNLAASTYIWLPLHFSGTTVTMDWYYSWTLNVGAGTWAVTPGTPPTTGSFTELINQNSGMCLSAVNTTEGTQLEQITCNAGTLQEWDVTSFGSNYYITNQATSYVADDSGQSLQTGAPIIDYGKKSNGSNQQWIFANAGNGYFNIINAYSGLCLDVTGASQTSGAHVDQWTCNGGTNQLWKQ